MGELVGNQNNLVGRTAIVTGPAKGVGAEISRILAAEGADLVLAGRDVKAMAPLQTEIEAMGRRAIPVSCDVTDDQAVAAMVATAGEVFDGRIDILVNVAGGRGIGAWSWDTDPKAFADIMDLNVRGCFLTMRAVLPVMMERRYGKIVNIGGTFGLRGRAGRAAYSASKWGLRGLTKSVALEAGAWNVNVNSVCPGMIEGERFQKVCAEMARRLEITEAEARRRHESEYALERISTPRDVAEAVLFLASDRSRNITGQDLVVDGGWAM